MEAEQRRQQAEIALEEARRRLHNGQAEKDAK